MIIFCMYGSNMPPQPQKSINNILQEQYYLCFLPTGYRPLLPRLPESITAAFLPLSALRPYAFCNMGNPFFHPPDWEREYPGYSLSCLTE
jgi:hypothetical protein